MQGFTVDLSELDAARKIMADSAAQFRGIANDFAQTFADASAFGPTPEGALLAELYGEMHAAAGAELSAAEGFLNNVARGLHDVRARTGQTEFDNTKRLGAL